MKRFNLIAAILLTLLYLTGKIPPSEKFNLWITIFIIPFAMIANTVLVIIALVTRNRSGLWYLIPLVAGWPYMVATVGIKSLFRSTDTKAVTFTVMNYNISGFIPRYGMYADRQRIRAPMNDLILNPETDIQCYQEFTNFPRDSAGNILKMLDDAQRHYYFSMEEETVHAVNQRAGTLIVSKFPIVAAGDLLASNNGFNRIAFADVVIGTDTVRIVNFHLHSMGLGRFDPRNESNIRGVERATRTILSKLKEGVFERRRQVEELARFVENTPYPVVCVGDFNDMPYAYTYQYLRRYLRNAFEDAGSGFGFTYNGGTLRVLRIDNQFFGNGLKAIDLKTRYDLPYTDHFPVQGKYEIVVSP